MNNIYVWETLYCKSLEREKNQCQTLSKCVTGEIMGTKLSNQRSALYNNSNTASSRLTLPIRCTGISLQTTSASNELFI